MKKQINMIPNYYPAAKRQRKNGRGFGLVLFIIVLILLMFI